MSETSSRKPRNKRSEAARLQIPSQEGDVVSPQEAGEVIQAEIPQRAGVNEPS